MQYSNQQAEDERVINAAAHYVASAFVIQHPDLTNPGELSEATEQHAAAEKFLREREYEVERLEFIPLASGAHEFLGAKRDACIPNHSKGVICKVRGESISNVLRAYYRSGQQL